MDWLSRADVMLPEVAASEGVAGLEQMTRIFCEEEWVSLPCVVQGAKPGRRGVCELVVRASLRNYCWLGYFSRRCMTPGSCRETSEAIFCERLWGAGLV